MKIFYMSLSDFSLYLYPRMFSLHTLDENMYADDDGNLILPPWESLTKDVNISFFILFLYINLFFLF